MPPGARLAGPVRCQIVLTMLRGSGLMHHHDIIMTICHMMPVAQATAKAPRAKAVGPTSDGPSCLPSTCQSNTLCTAYNCASNALLLNCCLGSYPFYRKRGNGVTPCIYCVQGQCPSSTNPACKSSNETLSNRLRACSRLKALQGLFRKKP